MRAKLISDNCSREHGDKNHHLQSLAQRLKYLPAIILTFAGLLAMSSPAHAVSDKVYEENLKIFKQSPLVNKFFATAYGYAYFPVVGKGGIGIGGGFGKGKVYRQGTLTGKVSLVQLSLGFQLGGQAYSEIVFFQDKRAYDEFTRGTFEFDAKASAVAITAGVHAQAGTSGTNVGATAGPATGKQLAAEYVKGMTVFTHAKGGLMYEATVGGQKFFYEPLK